MNDKAIHTALCPGGSERMTRLLRLIQSGRIDPTPMTTHTFSFDQIEEAFALMTSKADGIIKPLITFACHSEYRLTDLGWSLLPLLTMLRAWGHAHLAGPEGPPVSFTHSCGAIVRPVVHCESCGDVLRPQDMRAAPTADDSVGLAGVAERNLREAPPRRVRLRRRLI